MIRKFNYTNRIKIRRADLLVSLNQSGGEISFDADIRIESYRSELPSDGAVYIEAYHRTRFNRFKFGTVNQIVPPKDRRLTAFSSADIENVRFRLKIVDEYSIKGKILGLTEDVSAISDDDRNAHRLSLLGVDSKDLGNRIWELDLEKEDRPWLIVNNRLPNVDRLLRTNDMFLCAVYPEIIRQILANILLDNESEDYSTAELEPDDEAADWHCRWLHFGKKLSGERWPPKNQDESCIKQWIEDCVDGFCHSQRVLQKATAILGIEE